jgi:hypothetical protein
VSTARTTPSAKSPSRAGGTADRQLVMHGNVVHSLTNPTADEARIEGVDHHAPAARRAWDHHLDLLRGVFA